MSRNHWSAALLTALAAVVFACSSGHNETGSIAEPGPGGEARGLVTPCAASFWAPIEGAEATWTWSLAETPAMDREYSWTVLLTAEDQAYEVGFLKFKFEGQEPGKGSLADLVEAGQLSIGVQTGENMRAVAGPRPQARVYASGMVIKVSDKAILDLLNRAKPPSAQLLSFRMPAEQVEAEPLTLTYTEDCSENLWLHKASPLVPA
jgi:hypothetical protein